MSYEDRDEDHGETEEDHVSRFRRANPDWTAEEIENHFKRDEE